MNDLINALKRLKVETGSLACLGCGREHNCTTRGCAIIREAIEVLSCARWISVEELPKENGRYIVAYEDAVSILDFFNGGWYFPWRTSDGVAHEETGTLQAWRMFPEPPKEDEI